MRVEQKIYIYIKNMNIYLKIIVINKNTPRFLGRLIEFKKISFGKSATMLFRGS